MKELIDQMLAASKSGQFHIALVAALILPDICSALESHDGQASGPKYMAWVDRWISPRYGDESGTSFSGETCWYYRCAMLHQGRAKHPKLEFERVAFLESNGAITMHDSVINNVLVIDIPTFCQDMVEAVRGWLTDVEGTANFRTNVQSSLKRFPSRVIGLGSELFVFA